MQENEDKEFYISTKNEKGDYLIYSSKHYKITEIDLINLIKICLIEARSKIIGRRLLDVYIDSTEHRPEITEQRLKLIGIEENGNKKPETEKKPQTK